MLKYGKKAWDAGKKFLPVLKKAKAAGNIGHKVHAGTEIVKKGFKRSPPTHGDGSELAKTDVGYGDGQVDPALASAAKKRHPIGITKTTSSSTKTYKEV